MCCPGGFRVAKSSFCFFFRLFTPLFFSSEKMSIYFLIGLFFAFVVLPLLSFLRNGAILRGGALTSMRGMRENKKNTSVTALQNTKHPIPPCPPLSIPSTVDAAPASPEPQSGKSDRDGVTFGEAMSPHSQSSQIFLQARRGALLRRQKVRLIQQRGGNAAEVAAAMREGATTSTGFDVASAWDAKQLGADDTIRLVFLFTFALPTFAFWCWKLRDVRPSYLLNAYCHLRGVDRDATSPKLQFALQAGSVFVPLGFYFLAFLYYAFFVYLDHRDKDVSLKRHNNTLGNRLVNWFKFRVYRRYVNLKCSVWKWYFSLQLVPAYGPLPLFLFPDGDDGEGVFSHEGANSKAEAMHFSGGGSNGVGSPSHHFTATAAAASVSARHNPFFVTVSKGSSGDDNSPFDNPLRVHSSPVDTPLTFTAHPTSSAVTTTTTVEPTTTHIPATGKKEGTTEGDEEKTGSDDWDEEEREALCTRSGGAAARSAQLPSFNGAPLAPGECSDSFSSADLTRALLSPSHRQESDATAPPQPPPMRRAHYFFVAHPHGILPWCCCVNMISNVTKRDAKLFVDNREAVLHSETADASSRSSAAHGDVGATAAGEDLPPPLNLESPMAIGGLPQRNTFTTTNTRMLAHPSPASTAAAAAAPTTAEAEAARAASGQQPQQPYQQQLRRSESSESTPSSPATSASTTTPYAKGRYYVYHPSLKKFVLRLDKDEAVPATTEDATVYRRRLLAEAAKKAAKDAAAGTANAGSSSMRQRLKIRIRAVVATFPFYVPIMREVYMFHGYMDASYGTCKRVLLYNNSTRRDRESCAGAPAKKAVAATTGSSSTSGVKSGAAHKGNHHAKDTVEAIDADDDDDDDDDTTLPDDLNHLMLFPGGASEALLSSSQGPAQVLLRRRKGFLRLALHTQSGLVPVYTFGETDYFDQFSTATTRYAAPLDDDSTFFLHSEAAQEMEGGPAAGTAASASAAIHNDGSKTIPSCTDKKEEEEASSCRSRSPRSPLQRPGSLGTAAAASTTSCSSSASAQRDTQQTRRKELEKRLLRDEEAARDREGRSARSPVQPQPDGMEQSQGKLCSCVPLPTTKTPLPSSSSSSAGAATTPTHSALQAGRFARFVQAVQRLYQETFGISLPVVRNLIPHRVTGATVVGRPIYFELPPDLQRMYTDPAHYYDREKEGAVLLAAQEVYFNELQELFLKYAPRYLKDPSRRKLEIL